MKQVKPSKVNAWVLPVIVIAQFFCTSLWFAGNAVLPDLIAAFSLPAYSLGHITAAVQIGFITGTLLFAALLIADRFKPSRVFFFSALSASFFNICMTYIHPTMNGLICMRFLTGFFLAGIYPVGMKIASDHFEKGLGKALGYLVGALVVGTAFPHLLKSFTSSLPWKTVIYFTSGLCIFGGLLMLWLVPSAAFQKRIQSLQYHAVFSSFKNRSFRTAAFGYFGHMWELYAFWAFVPYLLFHYGIMHPKTALNISTMSFYIIASGGAACIISGYVSQVYGAKKTAFASLFLSGCCCLFSPLAFYLPLIPFIIFMIFWGMVVIADSPMFSTLVAKHAEIQIRGTALTFVNCIGFSITIASIELLNYISDYFVPRYVFLLLAVGPIGGLLNMLYGERKNIKLNLPAIDHRVQ